MVHPAAPAQDAPVALAPDPPSVGVVVVSRDGARWLPAVLDGLAAQTVAPRHVRAVDAGSKDGSGELLAAALGAEAVLTASGATGFPTSVRMALEALPPTDWVWLLHDDARPEADALERLLAAAAADPAAALLGPKLREWPSLRRLLELGVTISGTGRRETGLERGEYDQGQHDEVRTVLAVNTAGLLVRRAVLEELGGLDEQLPIFGNDVDLGWRAAAAGHRTVVVPDAVVFHAEAAHRGVRRTPLTGRHTHYAERRAALYTLLANAPARRLPLRVVRLALGTVLRVLGFLLVRSVGEALDELAALVSVLTHPGELRRARRRRRESAPADPHDVRPLLSPWWLPYRHGLDVVGDVVAAATVQAQDVAERRRAAAQAERDSLERAAVRAGAVPRQPDRGATLPVDPDDELPEEDSGLVARFLTNPVAVLLAVAGVLVLVATAGAFGVVDAPGLPPAPGTAADWWALHAASRHELGTGTDVPAPAYVAVLALLASLVGLVGGSPALVVSLLLFLAVPVAFWGAWRLLRVVGRLEDARGAPAWLLALGAATYALVPLTSGAWSTGRLGVVVSAALLPWLAHAALGFADPEADRRWRAAWRVGLLLAVVTAFTPVAWPFALLLGVVVVAAAAVLAPTAVRARSTWAPPAVAVAVVPVLLAPWLLPLLWTGSAAGLLLESGRVPVPEVGAVELAAGRLGGAGAPEVLGLGVIVLALLALVPRRTRVGALLCWGVALVAAVVAAALSHVELALPATSTPPGLGWFVVLLQGCLVTAAFAGGLAVPRALARARSAGSSSRRAGLAVPAVLAVAAALALPLAGLAWTLTSEDRLEAGPDDGIPEYMAQEAAAADGPGVLVVRGDVDSGLRWTVVRGDGLTVGEDEPLVLTPEDTGLSAVVRGLATAPDPALVDDLARRGIGYVVLPAPADGRVAAVLDSATGLAQASAEDRATRAWSVAPRDVAVAPDAVERQVAWWRWLLLAAQVAAVVVVAVLAGPTRKESR